MSALIFRHPHPQGREAVLPTPGLTEVKFRVERLPPKWAVYFDEYPGKYFPFCTWGDCYENDSLMTPDLEKLRGRMLMSSALVREEDAQFILLYHLNHTHRLTHVVAPYEPYGRIYLKQPRPFWK